MLRPVSIVVQGRGLALLVRSALSVKQVACDDERVRVYKKQGRHEVFARGKNVDMDDSSHSLNLNEVDLSRPNKPEMEGPKTAAEEMQMMRKLYNEMVMEKAGIKGESLIQIGGIKKKTEDKEMAIAE